MTAPHGKQAAQRKQGCFVQFHVALTISQVMIPLSKKKGQPNLTLHQTPYILRYFRTSLSTYRIRRFMSKLAGLRLQSFEMLLVRKG